MSEIFKPPPVPVTELGRHRILAPSAGIRVSPLQLGGMSIGDAWTTSMGKVDKKTCFQLLDAFLEAGGNFIDTANNYQDGQSESWIGDWMKERGNRESVVLATKYTAHGHLHDRGKGPTSVNSSGNHKRSMFVSLQESLKRLQTDFVDIFYVHWWDWSTSIEEIVDSLHILVTQGKVLYLGISDSPAWVVSAANTYARAHGKTPFSIYQGRWNVMLRDFERDILPMARHYGLALAPWDVIGGGKFQTKNALEEREKSGEGLRKLLGSTQSEQERKVSEALAKVAKDHGTESVTAIALAYILAKAPYVYPIIGGRRIEHLKQNIEALSIKLTQAEIEYLESITPLDIGFPGTFIGTDPKAEGTGGLTGNYSHLSWVQHPKAIGR